MPALTETEQGERARSWTELLFGTIPVDRLNDAYTRAFKDHTTQFPLSAMELKTAWENIYADEAPARAAARMAQIECEEQELIAQGVLKSSPIIPMSEGVQIVRDHLAKLQAEKEAREKSNVCKMPETSQRIS